MARFLFPATDSDRTAYVQSGGDLVAVSAGTAVEVFLDEAKTQPADVQHVGGAAVTAGNPLVVDAYSRWPRLLGPADDRTRLWVSVAGGPATEIVADVQGQVDGVEARLRAVEPGGSAAALQVAENLGDLGDAAAARGNLGLGTAATRDVGTGASQVVLGGDARMSDARAPTAHATSHQPGGSDAMAVDAAAATGSLRTLGTSATSAAAGNDARLGDARTPTAHASSHGAAGSDPVAPAAIGAATSGHGHSGTYQPLDPDLTAIAGLTPSGSVVIQESGGVWAARTPAQVAATLPADQAVGTASLRTLGTGATQAAAGNTVAFPATAYGVAFDGSANDTAAFQAAIDAAHAAGGGVVRGTVGSVAMVSQLTLYSDVVLDGGTIKQIAGTTGDLIVGAGFSSLTLGGTGAGITRWGLRNITLDGNKANQSAPNRAVVVYGYGYFVENVRITATKGDGLYTEWARGLPGGITDPVESKFIGLTIDHCGGWGWHHRGPHDAIVLGAVLHDNATGNYLGESTQPLAITSGSNGASLPQSTIHVAHTVGYPAAGALHVTTSGGTQTVTYTGKTATTFTGCSGGTGTMNTGGAVDFAGPYSTGGTLLVACHAWGSAAPVGFQVDGETNILTGCVAEGCSDVQVSARAPDVQVTGGSIYPAGSAGCGIRVGDDNYIAYGTRVDKPSLLGFAGSSIANAAIALVNDGGYSSYDLVSYQTSGHPVWGTVPNTSRVDVQMAGAFAATNAAGGVQQWSGATSADVGSANAAFRLRNAGTDIVNVNSATNLLQLLAFALEIYSDLYSTLRIKLDPAAGLMVALSANNALHVATGAGVDAINVNTNSGVIQVNANTLLQGFSGNYSGFGWQIAGDGSVQFAAGKWQVEATKGYFALGTGPNTAIACLIIPAATSDLGIVVVPQSGGTGDLIQFQDSTAGYAAMGYRFDVAGRPVSAGTAPTVAAGAQSTAASAASPGVTDVAGSVTTTAKSSPAAGAVATVTFAKAYAATPRSIQVGETSGLISLYVSTKSTAGFTVSSRTAPSSGVTVTFDYTVVG